MKPKTYPENLINPLSFVNEFLLNQHGHLKAPALKALPDRLKSALLQESRQRGCPSDDLSESVFWIVNDLRGYPKQCLSCGTAITKFHSYSRGYPHSRCSLKCSNGSQDVKEKKIAASRAKYSTDFPWQAESVKQRARKTFLDNWFEKRYRQFGAEYAPLTNREDYAGTRTPFKWKHECGHEFSADNSNGVLKPVCPACRSTFGGSRQQRDIYDYVKSLLPLETIIIQNDRRAIAPLELDIFIPSKNLAIEYHGLYWHSYDRHETRDEKFKHFDKKQQCLKKGIRLVQIFEYEWEEKREIVKSRLRSILGCDERIFARQCSVKEVSAEETRLFLESQHIQGSCQSSVRQGLFYRDKLVAIMTFGRPRFSKQYQWELLRYCSTSTIVGGASKLLQAFKKEYAPTNIMSYADLRWSDGNLYSALGFSRLRISDPNYFYFKGSQRWSRYAFQKSRMAERLENFDKSATEHANAFANGYRRCWDAGNLVFIWSATSSKEQSREISVLSTELAQIENVTHQNTALVEEVSAAANSLKNLSEELVDTVSFFHLK
jgi:hypothetical protein